MTDISTRLRWEAERLGNKFSENDELFQLLIEAADALDEKKKNPCEECQEGDCYGCQYYKPVSEQPEIIRCSECKYYDGRPCGVVDWWNTEDDFCSRAERRTNGQLD